MATGIIEDKMATVADRFGGMEEIERMTPRRLDFWYRQARRLVQKDMGGED